MRTIGLCALAFGLAGAYAHAGVVVNGDFQTGNLTPWTTYTTAYGPGTGTNGLTCAGSVPCPIVTLFDTTGTGASDAAQFNVGMVLGTPGGTDYEGGGIVQNILLSPGAFNVSLDWAVDNLFTGTNADGGKFTILLNGTVLAFYDTGRVYPGIVRGPLSASTTISTGGTYQLAVEVTRNWYPSDLLTQYVDNVTTSGAATGGGAVPEPSGWELAVGGMVLIAGYRRVRTVCRP